MKKNFWQGVSTYKECVAGSLIYTLKQTPLRVGSLAVSYTSDALSFISAPDTLLYLYKIVVGSGEKLVGILISHLNSFEFRPDVQTTRPEAWSKDANRCPVFEEGATDGNCLRQA